MTIILIFCRLIIQPGIIWDQTKNKTEQNRKIFIPPSTAQLDQSYHHHDSFPTHIYINSQHTNSSSNSKIYPVNLMTMSAILFIQFTVIIH